VSLLQKEKKGGSKGSPPEINYIPLSIHCLTLNVRRRKIHIPSVENLAKFLDCLSNFRPDSRKIKPSSIVGLFSIVLASSLKIEKAD